MMPDLRGIVPFLITVGVVAASLVWGLVWLIASFV